MKKHKTVVDVAQSLTGDKSAVRVANAIIEHKNRQIDFLIQKLNHNGVEYSYVDLVIDMDRIECQKQS